MRQLLSLIRKEQDSYFGSPMALIFVGAFLTVTLFAFFWLDAFWLRGLADARPLFRRMPLLLIFLMAALTMRQWSEEQRAGTLELLLTLPVSAAQLTLAKFVSALSMALAALALTLPLPITVSLLGDLDWGPVWSGYLAALLLAAAYAAIGLFFSSRTDNQLVALGSTLLLGGVFYLVGDPAVTDLAGHRIGGLLRALGTGSRFDSIERGVIDLRDLIYYLALTLIFLMLNVLSLESRRWGRGQSARPKRLRQILLSSLFAINLALVNLWLYPLHALRVDATASRTHTLSAATKELLGALQEPLLVRAYISARTHPLLAPLAPRIVDILREYEIAARGQLSGEVVDPSTDPDREAEANQTYGIRPTPFQVADRYQSSVINAYFDILVRYGDQSVILGFADLIEIATHRDGAVDVKFQNLEYDLTSAIKRVVYGFQSVEAVLAALDRPARLRLIVTPALLPEPMQDAPAAIEAVAREIAAESNGKFTFETVDPDAAGASLDRQTLFDAYGLQPFPVSVFSAQSYYLHLLLHSDDRAQILYTTGDLTQAGLRSTIESALLRSAPGFLKVVGLWTPSPAPSVDIFGQPQPQLSSWNLLREQLSGEYALHPVTLETGHAPDEIDMLLVIAPQGMSGKARFAIDQYLMRGGSVVIAASGYTVAPDPGSAALRLNAVEGGLRDMLAHYGVDVSDKLVMDPQNEPFPVAIDRQANGVNVREIQVIPYPFFVDVRRDGMDREHPMLAGLNAASLNWVSPITLDADKNANRETSHLLRSTASSWLRVETNIQPNFEFYPDYGFPIEADRGAHTLAVAVTGPFKSYFSDRPSPWETNGEAAAPPEAAASPAPDQPPTGFLKESVGAARLVVFGSAEFINDFALDLSRSLLAQDRFLNNLLLMQNAVDWSVEDVDLLTIRARGSHTRVLAPLSPQQQASWEFVNYAFALLAVAALAALWRWNKRQTLPIEPAMTNQPDQPPSEPDGARDAPQR